MSTPVTTGPRHAASEPPNPADQPGQVDRRERTPAGRGDSQSAVTFPRVVRSEWIKLRSVRSVMITLLASALVVIAVGMLAAALTTGSIAPADGGPPAGRLGTDPTSISLAGVQLAQLIVAIVGVLLVSAEYSTGSIRGTLAAVPRRWPVLLAKLLVFGVVTFLLELVAVLTAFLAGQAVLGDAGVALTDTGVAPAVVGAAVFLAATGLMGVALGFLLRSTAAGIAVTVVAFFLVPGLLNLFSADVQETVRPYLPSSAGTSLTSATGVDGYLGYWPGLLLLAGYVVILVGAALTRLRRSDAT